MVNALGKNPSPKEGPQIILLWITKDFFLQGIPKSISLDDSRLLVFKIGEFTKTNFTVSFKFEKTQSGDENNDLPI